ncbi:hypothetical protein OA187_02130 [Candidatus Pelagibacter sp.]|nr:hypothetical protein [Candidatus Pelagibacter sp.]
MVHKIINIKSHIYSSKYGNNKVFGQPKNLRSGVIIEIQTKNGISGYGETYVSGYLPELTKVSLEYFSDNLIGKSLNNIEMIMKSLHVPFCTDNGFLKSILSAIEIALFDLISKLEGIPLYNYLNNKFRKNVLGYASGGSVIYDKKKIYDDYLKAKLLGFKFYKLRIGYQNFSNDLNRIEYAIKLFGKNNVMVDAIMGTLNTWDKKKFLKKVKKLNKLNLKWIEEPLHPSKKVDYKEVSKKTKIPIAIGESYTSFEEFKTIISNNSCKFIQPDITQCGIIDAIKICEFAKKKKKKISLHVWGSSLSFLINLHFALAFKEIDFIEFPLVKLDIMNDKIKNIYKINDGKIQINKKVKGLGININKRYINKFKFINKSGFKI